MSAATHFNPNFRPDIRWIVGDAHEKAFDLWRLDPTGFPVPAERRANVAVWFGQRLSLLGEVPVIVAATDIRSHELRDCAADWYSGVATATDIMDAPVPLEALTDAAYMPFPTAGQAIREVAQLLKPDHYGPQPVVLDLRELGIKS